MPYELHPQGVYNDVEITDHGMDISPEKKTPYLWVVYKTEAALITGRHYMVEGHEDKFAKTMKTLGFTGNSLKGAGLDDGTALTGNIVQITVGHKEYEGKTYDEVKWVNENNSTGGAKRMSKDDADKHLAKFDAFFKRAMKQNGTAEESDLPF